MVKVVLIRVLGRSYVCGDEIKAQMDGVMMMTMCMESKRKQGKSISDPQRATTGRRDDVRRASDRDAENLKRRRGRRRRRRRRRLTMSASRVQLFG